MQTLNYNSFLKQTKLLNDRYIKINSITGENFNLFQLFNIEHAEKTHTLFIAELLNPKGKHGQGYVFLKRFIELYCFRGVLINPQSCVVEVEKHIGFKSSDRLEGGRIDIMVTDLSNNHSIIIENKIHADDVDSQLVSYYNHSPESDLIYLTLDGKMPSESSSHKLEKDNHFKCLSYKKDIVNWLELCRNEVATLLIIRESITIYVNTLKYLTNQTYNYAMQEEMTELIKSNLESSFIIADNLDSALDRIYGEFEDRLRNLLLEKQIDLYSSFNLDKNWTGIFVCKPNWKYYNIGSQFQSYDKELRYGFIAKADPYINKIPQNLIDELKKMRGGAIRVNPWWGWYNSVEKRFDNWGKYQAWEAVMNGEMLNMMLTKVDNLLFMTENIEL